METRGSIRERREPIHGVRETGTERYRQEMFRERQRERRGEKTRGPSGKVVNKSRETWTEKKRMKNERDIGREAQIERDREKDMEIEREGGSSRGRKKEIETEREREREREKKTKKR